MATTVLQRTTTSVSSAPVKPGMGPGHEARHVLQAGHWDEYDPFLMLAEDWFVPGTFGDHPHRGIETVTFVIDGELEHRDNHGGRGVLGPGDAQWMTAGRGLIHCEESHGPRVHTLQLWVNLPAGQKLTAPRYQDLRGADMPSRQEGGATIRVFSGATAGLAAATGNHVPVTMVELRMEAGSRVSLDLPAADNAFIYAVSGRGRFGEDAAAAQGGQAIWLSRSEDHAASELVVEAVQAGEPLYAILWSGPPLREPVVARGPFVMNTEQQIMEAYADYRAGRF
jgi:hypothetical protein